MRDLCSVGSCFNAGDGQRSNNLRLERKKAWTGKTGPLLGITLIPFYVMESAGVKQNDPGLWKYDQFGGMSGTDSYKFEDDFFKVETERRPREADQGGK